MAAIIWIFPKIYTSHYGCNDTLLKGGDREVNRLFSGGCFYGGWAALLRHRSNRVCITDIGKLPDDFISVPNTYIAFVQAIGSWWSFIARDIQAIGPYDPAVESSGLPAWLCTSYARARVFTHIMPFSFGQAARYTVKPLSRNRTGPGPTKAI